MHLLIDTVSGRSKISQKRESVAQKGYVFWPFFLENCIQMIQNWPREGSLHSHKSAMVPLFFFSGETHKFLKNK